MVMAVDPLTNIVIPKPAYNVLRRLTGEARPDIALSLALKDLVRLRLEAAQTSIASYEQKYQMNFPDFEKKWQDGSLAEKHSYEVEQDFLNWEAAITDKRVLEELSSWMA
jgi:hypothetical protein